MFDETRRALRRLEGGQQISVSLPADEERYFDRKCPSSECLFEFKVNEDDWRDKVRDEKVFCAFCGHTADSGAWSTQQQQEYLEKAALAHLQGSLGRAMRRDAESWNRRQPRDSFIKITMKGDHRPRRSLLPAAATKAMRLKITCPACGCRYAVIGAAFFCPACGHNAAELVFGQSIVTIRRALDSVTTIRAAMSDRDSAEAMARFIIENALQNGVTAFQRYAEALYVRYPSALTARRNAFQNLADGNDLWHAASGKRYGDHLAAGELAMLQRVFQQRHLLAHREGLVDDDYIVRSGDTTYRTGQRLVVRETAVLECLTLIEKLAAAMAADVPKTS